MGIRFWTLPLIFISSYSPLALIVYVHDLPEAGPFYRPEHPFTAFTFLGIAALSVVALWGTMRSFRSGGAPITVQKVSNKSGELVNYAVPYMITFFTFDAGDWRSLVAFGLFMALMFALTVRTHNILLNPVLSLLGYNLYDVEYLDGKSPKQSAFLSEHPLAPGDVCLVEKASLFLRIVTCVNPSV